MIDIHPCWYPSGFDHQFRVKVTKDPYLTFWKRIIMFFKPSPAVLLHFQCLRYQNAKATSVLRWCFQGCHTWLMSKPPLLFNIFDQFITSRRRLNIIEKAMRWWHKRPIWEKLDFAPTRLIVRYPRGEYTWAGAMLITVMGYSYHHPYRSWCLRSRYTGIGSSLRVLYWFPSGSISCKTVTSASRR